MKKNRAVLELLAFGMDSLMAETLQASGWTIPKLRRQSDWDLMNLGISFEVRQALQRDEPQAIPIDTLRDVLVANRGMCCICRLPNQAVVAHTIIPLAAGGSYSAQNLTLLCKYHQMEALSTSPVCVDPIGDLLLTAKNNWEIHNEESDLISRKQKERKPGELNWWYFNRLGLYDVVKSKVDLTQMPSFNAVLKSGICDDEGIPICTHDAPSPYQGDGGLALYSYMFEILFELLGMRSLRNIYSTDRQGSVIGSISKGDLICFHGKHIFSHVPTVQIDRSLMRSTCRLRKVEISYVFDSTEGTSQLARSSWLRGQRKLASIFLVNNVGWSGDKYCITGIVLAIRSSNDGVRNQS